MNFKLPRLTPSVSITDTQTGKAVLYFTRLWDQFATQIEDSIQVSSMGLVVSTGPGNATTVSLSAGAGLSVTNPSGLAGNPTYAIANTPVTPGSYGDSTHVGGYTVNAQGQLTGAANVAITFPVTSVFGRNGAVVAAINDYSFAQISGIVGASQGGAGAISGILKANGGGVVSAAAANTDYAPVAAPSFTGQVTMTGLPTTNPGGSGKLWNNAGVLNIT